MKAQMLTVQHDDLLVVNAARVSFAKRSQWVADANGDKVLSDKDHGLIRYLAGAGHWSPFAHPQMWVQLSMKDSEMVEWLLQRGAGFEEVQTGQFEYMVKGSLFAWARSVTRKLLPRDIRAGVAEMLCEAFPYSAPALGVQLGDARPDRVRFIRPDQITDSWVAKDLARACLTSCCFLVGAPFFVARQLDKHQVCFVKNEVSRRYVQDDPTFWETDQFRRQSENKKQGSDGPVDHTTNREARGILKEANDAALEDYRELIARGVCAEQARAVLTMAAQTEWYWTASVAGYARVAYWRLDPHAQAETAEITRMIAAQMMVEYPQTWSRLLLKGEVP